MKGIPSDPFRGSKRSQDGNQYSSWPLRVYLHAFRAQKCSTVLPKVHRFLIQNCAGSFVYLDDILIASRSRDKPRGLLFQVLSKLQEAGLRLSGDKCKWEVHSLYFLGHHVSEEGIKPLSSRVETIRVLAPPNSCKLLQIFLGMVQYYAMFIQGLFNNTESIPNSNGKKRSRNPFKKLKIPFLNGLSWTSERTAPLLH
uniref:Putative LOC100904750 [Metaseiulus occidentalis] n=1 Tax=Lepeophtheirus salmonis TaxID=72036 RepID=A0A0K2VF78_LEPSM